MNLAGHSAVEPASGAYEPQRRCGKLLLVRSERARLAVRMEPNLLGFGDAHPKDLADSANRSDGIVDFGENLAEQPMRC